MEVGDYREKRGSEEGGALHILTPHLYYSSCLSTYTNSCHCR